MPTFADRGVLRGQRGECPTAVNPTFVDWSRYFTFKYLLIYAHEAKWNLFQNNCYSENLVYIINLNIIWHKAGSSFGDISCYLQSSSKP
jgi:hypothetical protein